MKFVTPDDDGTLLLNTMWLPTWIGCNTALCEELVSKLLPQLANRPMTEHLLVEANQMVINFIQEKHSQIPGLWKYLDAVKYIED